jgi:hypothetical protein
MARILSLNPIACLVLLLSLFNISNAAVVHFRTALAPRQSPAATTPTTTTTPQALPVSCADYSRIANLSIIALNSTLRGAFLRSSSLGTFSAMHILDIESPKLLTLKFDTTLNQQCGNLSALAVTEADRNLTAGTVAGMQILDAPGVAPGNLALPFLCVAFILMMGVPSMVV